MTAYKDFSEKYIESCGKEFWRLVFRRELEYLAKHLEGRRDILSVGCGPAIIEGGLVERGFNVTGLDPSREALSRAPEGVRTVEAPAEDMPFQGGSFDAVIYVASLQFIEDYRRALEKTAFVLRPKGRIIIMLLNPESEFFAGKLRDSNSYVHRIRHADIEEIETAAAGIFHIRTEYFLGVKEDMIFDSADAAQAALYVIIGAL